MANVLVVDDDPAIAEALTDALLPERHTVRVSDSVESALQALASTGIEVVILDSLEYRSYQIISALKARQMKVVLILHSGRRDFLERGRVEAKGGCFSQVLSLMKPSNLDDILTACAA